MRRRQGKQPLTLAERGEIVTTCRENRKQRIAEGKSDKPNFAQVARDLGRGERTVCKWWAQHRKLDEDGNPRASLKGNCGRRRHTSFSTDAAFSTAIDHCENLGEGEHVKDACAHLSCSRRTLYNYTHGKICWRLPPRQEIKSDTAEVRKRRREFASYALEPDRKRLKRKFREATFLDHKFTTVYGQNRTHSRQARR